MKNDTLAAHHAERHLSQHLADAVGGRDHTAASFVGGYTASFERHNGLRRLVLIGEWEVDPAAVARAAVTA